MSTAPFWQPKLEISTQDDGWVLISQSEPLPDHDKTIAEYLEYWAEESPDTVWLGRRSTDGDWTTDITGKGVANPVASFWAAAQMLEHLGEGGAAKQLMIAVEQVCATGVLTPDVGGTAGTQEVTDAVKDAITGSNSAALQ